MRTSPDQQPTKEDDGSTPHTERRSSRPIPQTPPRTSPSPLVMMRAPFVGGRTSRQVELMKAMNMQKMVTRREKMRERHERKQRGPDQRSSQRKQGRSHKETTSPPSHRSFWRGHQGWKRLGRGSLGVCGYTVFGQSDRRGAPILLEWFRWIRCKCHSRSKMPKMRL